jgi:hypothetical protein
MMQKWATDLRATQSDEDCGSTGREEKTDGPDEERMVTKKQKRVKRGKSNNTGSVRIT